MYLSFCSFETLVHLPILELLMKLRKSQLCNKITLVIIESEISWFLQRNFDITLHIYNVQRLGHEDMFSLANSSITIRSKLIFQISLVSITSSLLSHVDYEYVTHNTFHSLSNDSLYSYVIPCRTLMSQMFCYSKDTQTFFSIS